MKLNPLPIVFFVLLTSQVYNNDVTATTVRPSRPLQQDHDQPESMSCSAIKENNYRLLALELQTTKFETSLENRFRLNEEKFERLHKAVTNDCTTKLTKIEEDISKLSNSCTQNGELFQEINREIVREIAKIQRRGQEETLSLFKVKLEKIKQQFEKKQEELVSFLDAKLRIFEEQINQTENAILKREEGLLKALDEKLVKIEEKLIPRMNSNATSKKEGNWTYVLHRFDGTQNFDLNWADYKKGFGEPDREFWLGLEHMHQLTTTQDYELRVNLVSWKGKKAHASYKKFVIGSEQEGYPLKAIEGYSGDAGDGLSLLRNMKFTTKDKQQDNNLGQNCAKYFHGGWWYDRCYAGASLLTGLHHVIYWIPSGFDSIRVVEMMIRPQKS